jgi:hypothetical protein
MKLIIYSCLFSLLAFPLMAQSKGQIIDQCLANLESGVTQDTQALIAEITSWNVKWSGKFGQRAKMYPTRMNGYENDEATEFFR